MESEPKRNDSGQERVGSGALVRRLLEQNCNTCIMQMHCSERPRHNCLLSDAVEEIMRLQIICGKIQTNDPEGNRQHADEIASGAFSNGQFAWLYDEDIYPPNVPALAQSRGEKSTTKEQTHESN